jgi:hypothetical protein
MLISCFCFRFTDQRSQQHHSASGDGNPQAGEHKQMQSPNCAAISSENLPPVSSSHDQYRNLARRTEPAGDKDSEHASEEAQTEPMAVDYVVDPEELGEADKHKIGLLPPLNSPFSPAGGNTDAFGDSLMNQQLRVDNSSAAAASAGSSRRLRKKRRTQSPVAAFDETANVQMLFEQAMVEDAGGNYTVEQLHNNYVLACAFEHQDPEVSLQQMTCAQCK